MAVVQGVQRKRTCRLPGIRSALNGGMEWVPPPAQIVISGTFPGTTSRPSVFAWISSTLTPGARSSTSSASAP